MNVLVIGTGAIGGFYGSLLAKAGADVSVVARSDFEHVRQYGIDVESKLGNYHFVPNQVVRNASELAVKPDYVLLCIKVVPGADRIGLLKNAIGPDTSIVPIANGIGIEEEIARAFPDNELVSGLAFICVTRTATGTIRHQAYGRLALGNFPRGVSEKTRGLCLQFEKSGIDCVANEDIVTARWQKFVWNAAFNPLSVLAGGLGTDRILAAQEPLVRSIMQEVCALAEATGHPLPADIVDRNVSSTARMPPYKTSMLLDFEAGRPMETEAILGNAIRIGRACNVTTPHLDSLYALMQLRELQISLGRNTTGDD